MLEPPVFLYDGDCAFCSTCARFVERRIAGPAAVEPWQWADIEALGVTVDQVDAAVVWVDDSGNHSAGPEAIAALLAASTNRLWRACGWVLARRPVLRAAWPIYRWIAVNRHRMPGGTAQCSLPQAERDAGR